MLRTALDRYVLGLWLLAWAGMVVAGPTAPTVSLIIDDLGVALEPGLRVVALPGPLACSILPSTPHATHLAEAAHRAGKEVMLHLPMEAEEGLFLGQGGITHTMTHAALSRVVRMDLSLIPYVRGVNNHMGSLLTQNRTTMAWVMADLRERPGLFFIDSRTTPATVALEAAQAAGLSATRRDLFLDNVPQPVDVRIQFARLVALARLQGTAVGIAHPRPATLDMLKEMLPRLAALGVRLVPISETVARRAAEPTPLHNPYSIHAAEDVLRLTKR